MTQTGASPEPKGQPGIMRAALFGLCPRCGAKTLWAAPSMFADSCRACGQDFVGHELAGRGAYLVITPVTVLLIFAALTLDETVRLPTWGLLLIWPPLVALAVVLSLRLAKSAVLVARLHEDKRP